MLPRPALPKNQRAQYSKLRLLLKEPGLMRGSLVEMRRQCGKKSCRCRTEPEARHRSLYLGLSLNGKHRTVYIPAESPDPPTNPTREISRNKPRNLEPTTHDISRPRLPPTLAILDQVPWFL